MNKVIYALLVILTTALMGSSFTIGKIGLNYISPLLLVGLRFTIAGLLMALFVFRRKHPHTLKDWVHMATIGLFQTAGVMGCIFISLRTITASESSILTFMNPLLVIVLGTLFTGASYRIIQWSGVLLGFIGVFFTLGFHLHLHIGTWLGFLGALSWSIATLLIKRWGQQIDTWVLTAYQMLFGGVLLFISGLTIEQPKMVLNIESLTILAWLAVMASIVQFAVWFFLLHHGDPGKTSAFLFLAPFFGVLSGWLILGESVQWSVLIGGICIFAGIFLVNWPDARQTQV